MEQKVLPIKIIDCKFYRPLRALLDLARLPVSRLWLRFRLHSRAP